MHDSVLLEESIAALHVQKGGKYIDATLGAAGHTVEILKLGGDVLGIDQDADMIEVARERIKKACPPAKSNFDGSYILALANFRRIDEIAKLYDFLPSDGIIMDLGISSLHLDVFERGFSFKRTQEPLDMRLDKSLGVKASDLLNALDEKSLMDLFQISMDYFEAKSLTKKIATFRKNSKFVTVGDFVKLFSQKFGSVHPATKAMMALRISVNSELETLEETLPKAFSLLKEGANLAVISFHSGEDRVVKNFMKDHHVSKDPIIPTEEEIERNPRSRSAKLRIIKR